MTFDFADIINSISVFQLATFTLYLWIKAWNPFYNKVLIAFFVSQALGILAWMLSKYAPHITATELLITADLLWAPTLYLYADALTKKRKSPFLFAIPHTLPFLLLLPYTILSGLILLPKVPIGIIVNLQVILYSAAGVVTLIRYSQMVRQNYSDDQNRIRIWVTVVLLGYIVACFLPVAAVSLGVNPLTQKLAIETIAFAPFLIFFNILFYSAIANPVVIHAAPDNTRYQGSALSAAQAKEYAQTLSELMEKNQYFLEPELSLGKLSVETGISGKYLSQIINQQLQKSFYDYVNGLRIQHACLLLSTQESKTIQEIMYQSGFNSKTAFNTAFKKHKGITPSLFKNKMREKGSDS
ncbi:MAG: AraC family transcriptional regulator [Bacteroidales bacterium]|nr:AraC family transcriptional regulator [Bacteroidales bacterium]MBN2748185.1 AraC family transcriptional regulator [Bacteroidales bacterium]